MNTFCPISTHKIDDNIARINGALTVLTLSIILITGSLIPLLILFFDFLLRSTELSKYSLFSNISKLIKSYLNLQPKNVNSGPKIFAARIGFVFSALILIGFVFNLNEFSVVLTVIFGTCAFLESAFGFCIACKIYPFVYKLLYNS